MMAVFGVFLAIFFTLTAEMRDWERRLPVNFMRHPQVIAVVARLRRDVLDAYIPAKNDSPYIDEYEGFTMTSKTLILETLLPSGASQVVVWDFRERGVVRRLAYAKSLKVSEWTARGVPNMFSDTANIDAVEFEYRPYGVRLRATDDEGQLAIDQILQPRAYH